MRTPKRTLASAGAILLAATGLTLGVNASADAATCYGGAATFTKESGLRYAPTDAWFKTTSRCKDINVKLRRDPVFRGEYVKVCFRNAGCQPSFKYAENDVWTVIATDVKDGTSFRLVFDTDRIVSGHWAG